MAAEGKGWIGSVLVHLGLLGAVIGFSWYAARQDGENVEPVDPLLIDLAGLKIHALLPSSHPLPEDGSPIRIAWDKAHLHLMEQEL